jgi:hypothetical protein
VTCLRQVVGFTRGTQDSTTIIFINMCLTYNIKSKKSDLTPKNSMLCLSAVYIFQLTNVDISQFFAKILII